MSSQMDRLTNGLGCFAFCVSERLRRGNVMFLEEIGLDLLMRRMHVCCSITFLQRTYVMRDVRRN